MKKRYIALIVFAVLVAALIVWRLWPQSLSSILPDDANNFSNVYAATEETVFESGYPNFLHYRLEDGEQAAKEILDILNTSDYRPDFRNLLPWSDGSMKSGNDYDGRSATVHFYIVQDQTPRSLYIQFMGRSQVSISTEDSWGVYHATNPETLTALVEYIQTHGNKQ